MRLLFLFAAAIGLIASASPAPFDRAAWQDDFLQLKRSLEGGYANLAWKGAPMSGIDLPKIDRTATEALARAGDDAEAADAIRTFVAGFHDGHFSELPYLTISADPAPEPDRPVLDPAKPQAGCAALGFAPVDRIAFSLPLEKLPDFELVSDGLDSTFRTGIIRGQNATLGFVRIQAFRARGFPMTCLHAWSRLRKSGTPITADAIMAQRNAVWAGDLADAIRTLRERGADALVVDVGHNDGGDDSGDWLTRLLTARPVRSARLMLVDTPSAASYFDEQLADLSTALNRDLAAPTKAALSQAAAYFTAQKNAIGQRRCALSWVWHERRPWSPEACNRLLPAGYSGGFSPGLPKGADGHADAASLLSFASGFDQWFGIWTGPTYVLADQGSYSSAEMFAAVMQDNGIGRIVGVRTGGDGCGFMFAGTPVVLQHSRLRFRLSNCMRLRADGTNEEAGISPDIPVLPTEGESERARAGRAVSLMMADALAAKVDRPTPH